MIATLRTFAGAPLRCGSNREHVEAASAWTLGLLAARSLGLFARLVTGAEIRWVAGAPAATQRIYVANHTSHADFVLLWASLPAHLQRRTHPVAAADYWNGGPIRRWLVRRIFRAVLVQRQPRADRTQNPLDPMLNALDRGESLIIFPEGTRGSGDELLPFRCGIYHLLRERPDVEVIPVWIDNMHRVLPRGAVLPVPLVCSVTFGEPIRPGLDEEKAAFLARLRQCVSDLRPICAATTKSC